MLIIDQEQNAVVMSTDQQYATTNLFLLNESNDPLQRIVLTDEEISNYFGDLSALSKADLKKIVSTIVRTRKHLYADHYLGYEKLPDQFFLFTTNVYLSPDSSVDIRKSSFVTLNKRRTVLSVYSKEHGLSTYPLGKVLSISLFHEDNYRTFTRVTLDEMLTYVASFHNK